MKIVDMTLKEVKEYYHSTKCRQQCTENKYCPLHAGNCCLCDIVGFNTDRNINQKYNTQLGIDFDDSMKVKEVIEILVNKEID